MNKTKIAVDVFDKRAKEYQAKFMDVNLYADTFDLFCEHITSENAHILEVACGPGNITKYLLNKRPDLKIMGIDLSPHMLHLAQMNNPNAVFELMDCRDINKMNQKYDGIMCGFCMPYLSREECIQLIYDASILLKPDGILYISTMEDEYAKSGLERSSQGDEVYIHYHEAGYLTEALQQHNFVVIDLQRKQDPSQVGTNRADLIIVSKKQNR